jgi:hypothetical protein
MELTAKEKAKDLRLRKKYRWTLAMYNALSRAQNDRCGVCGRPVKTAPLNLDHEHFKIVAARILSPNNTPDRKWGATTRFKDGRQFLGLGKTKTEAIVALKEIALPASVRGLLCPGRYTGCNRLMGRIDDILWLKKVIAYLENPPARTLKLEEEK